jgi:hypothetical protein
MPIEDVSDDELFNEAISDEAADGPSAPEQIEQEREQPARDEAGRFAAREAPEVETETVAEKLAVGDEAPQVPSWRIREINEEKRALQAERDALLAERQQWQRQQPTPQTQREPAKVERPDPLLDPDGYASFVREEIRQEALAERREESLQRAAETHPAEFQEAYTAAQKAVDPALRARMQNSRDPGKTLLEWHRETKTRQEIGGDLTAYKQRLRDEALKDPEFRKAAMEAWRADAPSNGKPRVELPPSMSSASRSNAMLRGSANDDVSDAELFKELAG